MRFLCRINLQNPISVSNPNPIEDDSMKCKMIDNQSIPLDNDQIYRNFNISSYPGYRFFYFKRYQGSTVIIDLSGLSPLDGDTIYLQCDRGSGSPQNYWIQDTNRSMEFGSTKSTLSLESIYNAVLGQRDLLVTLIYLQSDNCWMHFVEPNHKGEFNIYPGYHWTNPGGGN